MRKHFLFSFQNEEIIELEDVRVSPIPYLRRSNKAPDYSSDVYFPPSLRKRASYYSQSFGRKHSHASHDRQKKPYVIKSLKKGAIALKAHLPKVKDINSIDKFARVMFPGSFILFNSVYWCFYVF